MFFIAPIHLNSESSAAVNSAVDDTATVYSDINISPCAVLYVKKRYMTALCRQESRSR